MAFSRTLLAVLNSGVLTRWRLTCIIYDTVLITESSCRFLGSRCCIPDGRRVSRLRTRVLLSSLCRYKSPFLFFFLVLRATFPELSARCPLSLFSVSDRSDTRGSLLAISQTASFMRSDYFLLLSCETRVILYPPMCSTSPPPTHCISGPFPYVLLF